MLTQNSVVLTAMTLRGIGSYLYGARLEFRPLTVLCGTNGSGKSTWLKVLNLLRRSLETKKLPFAFDIADWATDNIELMNAFYHLTDPDAHAKISDPDATLEYGPPGTIGLEFETLHDLQIGNGKGDPSAFSGKAQRFLWGGECPKGTRFRLRLAHPTYWADTVATPELTNLVDLEIDGRFTITMSGERSPLQRFEEGYSRPRGSSPYQLSCSTDFIPDLEIAHSGIVTLATITDLVNFRCESDQEIFSEQMVKDFIDCFEERLLKLLSNVLYGYYYIAAVRKPHTYLSLNEMKVEDRQSALGQRYVGPAGENVWLVERHFAYAEMRPIVLGPFQPENIRAQACLELFSEESRANDAILRRIWEFAAVEARDRVEHIDATSVGEGEASKLVADLLNSILDKPDLFSDEVWRVYSRGMGPDGDYEYWDYLAINCEEAKEYVTRDVQELSRRDLARMNYLLIEDALNYDENREYRKSQGINRRTFTFESYVSSRMRRLTDVGIGFLPFHNRLGQWDLCVFADHNEKEWPDGFLVEASQFSSYGADENTMQRMIHPCFGEGVLCAMQPPRQLSSGFHQVFPIIVQLGLMKKDELVGIENPEVHLHPSLQLRLAEMLIAHASTGRYIFVETHSDLLVRRVIRAILEEKLPQSGVQIYFTDLQVCPDVDLAVLAGEQRGSVKAGFRHSTLRRVCVDERGRIANWPDGFLDDDVRESQRLLDIMYGGNDAEEDDE